MIYLASPYSDQSPIVRESRYDQILHTCMMLNRKFPEKLFYSPIVHFHELSQRYDLPTDADFWWLKNKAAMDSSEALIVVCLEGWPRSSGVLRELDYARDSKLPTHFVDLQGNPVYENHQHT